MPPGFVMESFNFLMDANYDDVCVKVGEEKSHGRYLHWILRKTVAKKSSSDNK